MKKICIVGIGLIGASIALALKDKDYKVSAIDNNSETLDFAINEGIISKGYLKAEPECFDVDILLLAVYPDVGINFIKSNYKYFKNKLVVTDVIGLKGNICRLFEDIEGDFVYVGGHPMAGSEFSGIRNAEKGMFSGSNFIISPSYKAGGSDIELVRNMAFDIGCSKVFLSSPEEHDRFIAYTSHLPHLLAIAFCDNPLYEKHSPYSGRSFRDCTRVANINFDLWPGLIIENAQNNVQQIETLQLSLDKLKELIQSEDRQGLSLMFKEIKKRLV